MFPLTTLPVRPTTSTASRADRAKITVDFRSENSAEINGSFFVISQLISYAFLMVFHKF